MVGRPAGLHNRGQEALSTGNSTSDIAIGSNTRLIVVGLSAIVRAILETLNTGRRGRLGIVRLNRGDFSNVGRSASRTPANLRRFAWRISVVGVKRQHPSLDLL